MILGDLYRDVRLYSDVETIIVTEGEGGWEWEDIWEGLKGRRWQGDEE